MVVDISCPPDGHIRPLKTEADRNSLGQKIGGPETSDGSTPKKPTWISISQKPQHMKILSEQIILTNF